MPELASTGSGLVLTAIVDGPLSGGLPKAIELYALEDIADLSVYGLGSANNGGGTDGQEFGFPPVSVQAGSYLYLATESTGFAAFFGFAPDFVSATAASINGDDAIELFLNGTVVDTFGTPDASGSGTVWDYRDGWAARNPGTGPSPVFDPADWTYSGADALDDATANASAAAPVPLAGYGAGAQALVINEVLGSTTGTDVEYVELYGTPGQSLAGLSLIVVESDAQSDNGHIDARIDFDAGDTLGTNGFFLVGTASVAQVYGVTPDLVIATNTIENSSYTLALVETASLSGTSVTGTETVIDSLGVTDGEGAGSFAFGAPVVGPDGSFLPAGARRAEDGVDTDSAADFVLADFNLGPANTPTAATREVGGDYDDVFIHDIQGETDLADGTLVGVAGAADESPMLGAAVRVQAVVTQVVPGLGGFYIQEEDSDADGNAKTSEGIFVASTLAVAPGDLVTVEGIVAETGGETRINADTVAVDGTAALPEATVIAFPTATVLVDADGDYVANLEAYEGMLVTIPEEMSVTEMFQLDRFGTIRISSDGQLVTYTEIFEPGVEGYAAYLKEVAARSLVLDDGSDAQNPAEILVPFLGEDGTLDGGDVIRMGDVYTGLTGVLSYSEDSASSSEEPEYRIHLPQAGELTATNPRSDAPEDVGGSLTVASFNVLNYFTTIDTNPGSYNGPYNTGPGGDEEPRGANAFSYDGLTEFDRQEAKLVAAIKAVAADVVGLIEIENDPLGSTSLAALVAALNAEGCSYAYVDTGPIEGAMGGPVEGDAIKVGFLYNTETVSLTGDFAILDETVDSRFATEGVQRPALAQTFTETASGESFTAVVTHLKSKGSVLPGDEDIGDGQGANNATRTEAAKALADWLASDPTGSGDPDVLIIGDLNAYTKEDPVKAIEAGADDIAGTADDFVNVVTQYDPDGYSYVFDGMTGSLDHALASGSLADQVTGATIWNINADEADALDYNLDYGRDGSLYTADPYRASDHDPVVVGLDLQSAPRIFTLEILHVSDQEGSASSVKAAPNLSAVMNALEAQDLGNDGLADNTIRLSSGDAFIPGVFFEASASVFGSGGIADIQIQNELGFDAIALGNHEFDKGTAVLAGLISGDAAGDFSALTGSALAGQDFTGTLFPYLSANLDVSTDANLAPLAAAGGQAPQGNSITSSTVLDVNGDLIGIVGATTPTLGRISSPGGVTISPDWEGTQPTEAELDALAAVIQAEVDAVLAAHPGMNKVILMAHMQILGIELALASRLSDVDVILAGGSNTLLADETDRLRDDDAAQGTYPQFVTDADGNTVAVVNTDGSYKYVGRLVIDFDEDGHILADSYDAEVSGAYATDDQGVADLGAEDLVDPEIQAIADAIGAQIVATEGNVFGISEVFLNGNRSGTGAVGDTDGVRIQETNLGDLTADANLAAARAVDDTVLVSIKNGGGIRASIGETVVPAGGTDYVRQANGEIVDADGEIVKPEGGISETDIKATLAFNNALSLVTVTRADLVAILEHGVAAAPSAAGQFPQVSGVQFSFDPDLPAGARIVSAAITDADGNDLDVLVRDGQLVGDADGLVRVVTLNFMADGGDGYPFPQGAAYTDRVDLADLDGDGSADGTLSGVATFAADGTEQDALAEYLAAHFGDADSAFDLADTGAEGDERIQNLNYRDDTVIDAPALTLVMGTAGNDRLTGTDGDDLVVSGAGFYETMLGGAGADLFYFGDEALNGSRERDFVLDYEVGVDRIALGQGVEIGGIVQSGTSVVVYLDDPLGQDDAIYVRGSGVTAANIDFVHDYTFMGA
ncbi:hypothetical protein BYZ73_12710 [Rhodovulum viride]|uniref:Extracellular nuclease n=1 Tax=Rhodovulum viride TaxID=1231134 RepID=A0ABX9DGI2_9RHOB|nr:ExeM/NucH family extracellular endonuclease [Rhodovulum viride]RAP40829.1 hypothetical protein BYZ73_12710 [Rhodovulum viride]